MPTAPAPTQFNAMVIGVDRQLVAGYGLEGTDFDGRYIDNTSIYHAMMNAVPEPTSLLLLVVGGLMLLRRRGA